MKLIERELGLEIELNENKVSVLLIENIGLRAVVINELYSQIRGCDGDWLLVENEKSFTLSKSIEMILEPFSLELNNKRVKTKLYQDIKDAALDYFFEQGTEVHSYICNYLENVLSKLPYPMKYDDEWKIIEILKAYSVEIEDEHESVFEKLFNYIKIVNQICAIRVFVLVEIRKYLSKSQIEELYKLAMYNKIQLVFIEFSLQNVNSEYEETFVIDEDSCIITY